MCDGFFHYRPKLGRFGGIDPYMKLIADEIPRKKIVGRNYDALCIQLENRPVRFDCSHVEEISFCKS